MNTIIVDFCTEYHRMARVEKDLYLKENLDLVQLHSVSPYSYLFLVVLLFNYVDLDYSIELRCLCEQGVCVCVCVCVCVYTYVYMILLWYGELKELVIFASDLLCLHKVRYFILVNIYDMDII